MNRNKVTLYLMTLKGYEVLNKICNHKKEYLSLIDLVVVSRDNAVSKDYFDEIVLLCKQYDINYVDRKERKQIKTSFSIAISWRWMIKNVDSKLIVIHDSLLPKYRGFSPLVNSLINGEPEIGVTALYASDTYDQGPIISQLSTTVDYPIKINTAIQKISRLYQELVLSLFDSIHLNKGFHSTNQDESKATYSLWRDEHDYLINWNKSSEEVIRFINSVGFPFTGAKAKFNGSKVVIEEAETYPDVSIENRDVGKVIFIKNGYPIVVCKKGLIKITKAYLLDSKESILPLNKFRSRFHV